MVANGVKALVATTATVAVTFGMSATSAQAQLIQIDGSSTVFPITEAMAEEFMAENSDVRITVGVSGTGGGFSKFCNGETDISNASRPIKESEAATCAENGVEYIQLPVASDALTVVVHPNNTWAEEMTVEQLEMLWAPEAEGTITRWNQIDPSWPNRPINLFGPGTDSGTFDYFTEEIVGESGASRADYTASEDDNVLVLGVARDPNALGYFGMAYYLENQDSLKAVAVDGVLPTPENVENNAYTPLSRPIFIYVSKDALERPEVSSFVEYYLSNARDIVPEIGYVPFQASRYENLLGEL
ncbi:Putative substrate binding domain of ABC phosphate transporter [Halomicronema hongdechloris C2206]|uniref:Phosphate-binding protein n=1 Tax=Halomicronema hongdechloris C2206 TaxID=1641165 RepID=A0A1Z3HUM0_9CYAN|nr:PstS family phosphate ABC transporter substrate-binding protein [Halomicronema hongdechloris]ASC74004.1 Putative substrate binding domain of ABC phosphate transporter [Halomicronema hongdechloris C2206]